MKQLSKIIILNCYKRKQEGLIMKKLVEQAVKGKDIDVEISYDDGSLNIWGNYKQALMSPSKEEERFRLIIQDDITIGRQTIDKIIHILQFMPDDSFVSFYCPGNKGYMEAQKNGHRILKTKTNFADLAFCFPTKIKKQLITWCDDNIEKEYRYEDRRIQRFVHEFNYPIYCVIPSLFQHLGAFRSTMGHSGEMLGLKRYSKLYQPEIDVVTVDWEKEIKNAYIHNYMSTIKLVDKYMIKHYEKIHEETI